MKCHVEMPSLYHLSPVTPLKMNGLNLEIPKSPNISQLKKEKSSQPNLHFFRFKIGKKNPGNLRHELRCTLAEFQSFPRSMAFIRSWSTPFDGTTISGSRSKTPGGCGTTTWGEPLTCRSHFFWCQFLFSLLKSSFKTFEIGEHEDSISYYFRWYIIIIIIIIIYCLLFIINYYFYYQYNSPRWLIALKGKRSV